MNDPRNPEDLFQPFAELDLEEVLNPTNPRNAQRDEESREAAYQVGCRRFVLADVNHFLWWAKMDKEVSSTTGRCKENTLKAMR